MFNHPLKIQPNKRMLPMNAPLLLLTINFPEETLLSHLETFTAIPHSPPPDEKDCTETYNPQHFN